MAVLHAGQMLAWDEQEASAAAHRGPSPFARGGVRGAAYPHQECGVARTHRPIRSKTAMTSAELNRITMRVLVAHQPPA
jgi:hypothetical protein